MQLINALFLPHFFSDRLSARYSTEVARYFRALESGLALLGQSFQVQASALLKEISTLQRTANSTAIYHSPAFFMALNGFADELVAASYLAALAHLEKHFPDLQISENHERNIAALDYYLGRQQAFGTVLRQSFSKTSARDLLTNYALKNITSSQFLDSAGSRDWEQFQVVVRFFANEAPRALKAKDKETQWLGDSAYINEALIGSSEVDFCQALDQEAEDAPFESPLSLRLVELERVQSDRSPSANYREILKAKARANSYSRQNLLTASDKRRLTDEQLYILDQALDNLPQGEAYQLLLCIYTGSSKSAGRIRIRKASGALTLEILTHHAKTKGSSGVWVALPYLRRHAKFLAYGLKPQEKKSHIQKTLSAPELVKSVGKISIAALESALTFSMFDLGYDDVFSTLLFGPTTSISQTKLHYIQLESSRLQDTYAAALSHQYQFQPDNDLVIPAPSSKRVGAPDFPDVEQVRDWLAAQKSSGPIEALRAALLSECAVLLHRNITDPKPIRVDLAQGSGIALSDKNRGGNDQMMRLVPLSGADEKTLKNTDDSIAKCRLSTQVAYVFEPDTRFMDILRSKKYRPKDLVNDAPKFPGKMNFGRKLWRTKVAENDQLYYPLADAVMGWGTHGLTPFSAYSTLSLELFVKYWRTRK